MQRTFVLAIAFAALVLSSCGSTCRLRPEPGAALEASTPVFPGWTCESLGATPPDPSTAPTPRFTAVLVAKGYLTISFPAALGSPADYFEKEPCVWLLDGRTWRKAELVAMDKTLALVRAEIHAAPWPMSRTVDEAALVVALPIGKPGERAMDVTPRCGKVTYASDPQAALLTCGGAEGLVPGAAVLDAQGHLMAVVNHFDDEASGPTAPAIRDFLDEYFASWGRHVTPKPEY